MIGFVVIEKHLFLFRPNTNRPTYGAGSRNRTGNSNLEGWHNSRYTIPAICVGRDTPTLDLRFRVLLQLNSESYPPVCPSP